MQESNNHEAYHMIGRPSEDSRLIRIDVSSTKGALHAFTTLAQMFYRTSDDIMYLPFFPFSIRDWPRFNHRGLNLDIARNEISPEDVIKTLGIMKWSKFNKLHLHATDSQSWPLEIPVLPELHQKGAYRAEHVWSTIALKNVQEAGRKLGIEVYLEIDMPGHTASIYHSHSELVAGYGAALSNYSAYEPPAGQLCLNSSVVNDFVDVLLADILPRSVPYNTVFHLGGDELNKNIYALDATVKNTDKKVLQPLLQRFYDRALFHVEQHHLIPIFWQEALIDWNLTLPENSIIQIWRPEPSVLEAVLACGHKALFGAASHWYLDCGFGGFLDPSHQEDTVVMPPYNDWCSPYKSWRQVYSYNPLVNISSHLHHLVQGGEVHLWGELTDSVNLDGKLWPRAAAAGEILWSGPVGIDGLNEDVTQRLAELRERLVNLGVRAEVVQMTWCLMNRGGCVA